MSAKILKRALFGLFFGLICLPTLTLAELYYYRDENGILHVTNIPVSGPWRPYFGDGPRKNPREDLFVRAARRFGLDPALLRAIARAESNFDPRAVSPKGALGLMQLMPETARDYGVTDPFDPQENLFGAAAFLRDLLEEFGDLRLALAAYNAGPQRVRRYGGIPPFEETKTYIQRVLRFWRLYRQQKNFKLLSKNP